MRHRGGLLYANAGNLLTAIATQVPTRLNTPPTTTVSRMMSTPPVAGSPMRASTALAVRPTGAVNARSAKGKPPTESTRGERGHQGEPGRA